MTLKSVRMELARDAEHPDGDPNHGYEFKLPLNDDGTVDTAKLPELAQLCTVTHFRGTNEPEHGQLVELPDHGWAFSYAPGEDDDEPVVLLSKHLFREGEYLSVKGHDGHTRTFRIVAVQPVHYA